MKTLRESKAGIQYRLIKVFAVQASLVSIATILGVLAAYSIAEKVLVKQALVGEAAHYWQQKNSRADFPLPDTHNMSAYSADVTNADQLADVPATLHQLPPSFFGRVALDRSNPDSQRLVLIDQQDNQRLWLIFNEQQVSQLAIMFGVAPLAVVLVLIYLASWFTFRQSQRLVSPISDLVDIVEQSDIGEHKAMVQSLAPLRDINSDIDALVSALSNFSDRLSQFIDRERSFTRNASHELRTPLAIIKGSVDILTHQTDLADNQKRVLERMRSTIDHMDGLINTLLMLARENYDDLERHPVDINALVQSIIESMEMTLSTDASMNIVFNVHEPSTLEAPEQSITMVLTNLIKNAIQHGGGKTVTIDVSSNSITIADDGAGMDANRIDELFEPFRRASDHQDGHGLGLSIVKKICDTQGWALQGDSAIGQGTTFTIHW